MTWLDFEKPIATLDARIGDLRATAAAAGLDLGGDIARWEGEAARLLARSYAALAPFTAREWQNRREERFLAIAGN